MPDILTVGEAKLKSSSLSTFNRKICTMKAGGKYNEESDSLPPITLSVNSEPEESNNPHEEVV